MYRIEKTAYGLKVTSEGASDLVEAQKFNQEMLVALADMKAPWGMLSDNRASKPIPPDIQATMAPMIQMLKQKEMTRTAMIVPTGVMKMQLMRLAKEHGTLPISRYIDASTHPDWEERAVKWIVNGVDPDL